MIAAGRPFLPLFLHVLGAMVLVGAIIAVILLALTSLRRNADLRRAVFRVVLILVLPAWLVMRIAGQWIYSEEGWTGDDEPTWLGIGYLVGDLGLLILLIITGVAFWWRRSSKPLAGRILVGLSAVYLALLTIAWLAMSGKWGS